MRQREPAERPADAREVLEALDAVDADMGAPGGRAPRFVGRGDLLATFAELLRRTLSAEPAARALYLHGPPGIGRSRLLQEMKWAAQLSCLAIEAIPTGDAPVAAMLSHALGVFYFLDTWKHDLPGKYAERVTKALKD